MFIICTNTCFNLHIIFIRFVHGVSYLLHRILQGNVGETRFISISAWLNCYNNQLN